MVAGCWISADRLIPGWATLVVGLLFLIGLQFLFLGIIGEYVGRIYVQVRERPRFIIANVIEDKPHAPAPAVAAGGATR